MHHDEGLEAKIPLLKEEDPHCFQRMKAKLKCLVDGRASFNMNETRWCDSVDDGDGNGVGGGESRLGGGGCGGCSRKIVLMIETGLGLVVVMEVVSQVSVVWRKLPS